MAEEFDDARSRLVHVKSLLPVKDDDIRSKDDILRNVEYLLGCRIPSALSDDAYPPRVNEPPTRPRLSKVKGTQAFSWSGLLIDEVEYWDTVKARCARLKPMRLAFISTMQFKHGRIDEAKASLVRLRETMSKDDNAKDKESLGMLREAEELIEGRATTQPAASQPGTSQPAEPQSENPEPADSPSRRAGTAVLQNATSAPASQPADNQTAPTRRFKDRE